PEVRAAASASGPRRESTEAERSVFVIRQPDCLDVRGTCAFGPEQARRRAHHRRNRDALRTRAHDILSSIVDAHADTAADEFATVRPEAQPDPYRDLEIGAGHSPPRRLAFSVRALYVLVL